MDYFIWIFLELYEQIKTRRFSRGSFSACLAGSTIPLRQAVRGAIIGGNRAPVFSRAGYPIHVNRWPRQTFYNDSRSPK
jgi:hypothetical protein